ncbi:MAG TPA: acyl-CoA dehydrogenase family protein [Thermohalobaculum sp.]|nr:acyl-CoA dehydrogenase family protein [Thermohalobaculum sp.]
MDFRLNDEQRLIVDTARRVGERFGLDYWRDLDARKAFPAEIWQAICEAGLAAAALPEEHGGSGLGMMEVALIVETLAASGAGSTVGQMFMNNTIFGGVALTRFGTEAMQRDYLPKLATGEMKFCMALTEPNAGSNALEIETFARADGNGFRINGRKIWITGVPEAHKMLVIARTKKRDEVARRTDGITMFLIDREREGLDHAPIDKVGTNTLSSSMVFFDDVRATPDEVVGTLDGGWRELLDVLNTERIVTSACLVGTAELALRLAVEFANERKVFGDAPIGSYQGLQFPLAQAFAETEMARLMNYKAATLYDNGEPYGTEANVAKLIAAQAAHRATERSMQTMGGMGYAKESHVERLWRDARLFRIAPISEEMILNFIAQHNLKMPRSY